MPTVETNGVETYYERYGDGPPIVFSHGSGWDCRSWMPQVRGLSTDYEVVIYDVRGHGQSGSPGVELEHMSELADDLHALIDALDVQKPVIGGCSMGGRIAYTYAAQHPDALAALVTLEAPVIDGGLSLGQRLLVRGLRTGGELVGPDSVFGAFRAVQSVLGGEDAYATQRLAGIEMTKAAYIEDAVSQMDAAEQLQWALADRGGIDLSAIQVPTLVLTGADPAERYSDAAETLVDRIPNARREMIPDAGHGAHIDNPVEFNRAMRLFLDEIEACKIAR